MLNSDTLGHGGDDDCQGGGQGGSQAELCWKLDLHSSVELHGAELQGGHGEEGTVATVDAWDTGIANRVRQIVSDMNIATLLDQEDSSVVVDLDDWLDLLTKE